MKIEYIKPIFLNKIYIGLYCLEIKLDNKGIEKSIDNVEELASQYKNIYITGDLNLEQHSEIQKLLNKINKNVIDNRVIIEIGVKTKKSFTKGNVEYFINTDIVDYKDEVLSYFNNRNSKFMFFDVNEITLHKIINYIKNYNLKKDKVYISLQNINLINYIKCNEYNLLFYIKNIG